MSATDGDQQKGSSGPGAEITRTGDPDYDFGGACFDLDTPEDREIVRFILSQALFGEATGVYCGKSLYAAGSLEAARFYVRQLAKITDDRALTKPVRP